MIYKCSYKIFVFYLTSILFACFNIYSQSPGYLSKRFLVGYGIYASPALFGSTNKGNSVFGFDKGNSTTGVPAFNILHEGFVEVVSSHKWSVCFSVRYYKTKYDNALRINYVNKVNDNSYINGRPSGFYDITGLTYTLYFKYYGERYVAPWGRYLLLGPTLNTIKTTYDPATMNIKEQSYLTYQDSVYSDFGPRQQSFKRVNLMLGFGRNRIYYNKLSIDYGVNMQLLPVLSGMFDLVSNAGADFYNTSVKVTNLNYIEYTNKKRVRGINRFNAFIKIGYLF